MFGFSLLMMPGLAEEGTGVKVKKEGAKQNEGGDKKGVKSPTKVKTPEQLDKENAQKSQQLFLVIIDW